MTTHSSSTETHRGPYAVVVGLDSIVGVQAARALASHDVPVIGVAKDRRDAHARTNVCDRIIEVDTSSNALIETLVALGRECAERPVLYTCGDKIVLFVAHNRARLDPYFHVLQPPPDVLEMLIDKSRFAVFAEANGLPIPKTMVVRNEDDAERAARELDFPCAVKPATREQDLKCRRVHSADEWREFYAWCRERFAAVVIQEWIEGEDSDVYSCNLYTDGQGRALTNFVSRKLRQWPPLRGVNSLRIEARNDVVRDHALRLFEAVGFHGLCQLEMKRDARTGEHLITEPNVGRPSISSALVEASGVPLLYCSYCDAIGRELPGGLEQKYRGKKFVVLRSDLRSAYFYWRRGELTLRQWWHSMRGPKTIALWSWRDPLPFWLENWQALHRGLGLRPSRSPVEPLDQ